MPLNDKAFEDDIFEIFESQSNAAKSQHVDNRDLARRLAKRINDEIRNGDVQPGIRDSRGDVTVDIGKIL